ncbi:hypothetical protein HRI_004742400 [Hibiscus trionum]|uniref:Uncharacterized protein n=1 Tax=Hibiscus trionum TaxID=183268 RepID=A0A9W7J9E5_HIBTR|nr:hypothetical protein HRI_004742400 [Hibiscus trionum]
MDSRLSGLENEKNQLKFGMQSQEQEIERLRKGNSKAEEDLSTLQSQVWDRDCVVTEALVQEWEVAEHLQTLAIQADVLSLQTESKSNRGMKLAWLFKKIKIIGVKAKQYM